VGDAAQTIYSFTGASPQYLLEFPRRFPDARVVKLVRDYRSTPQVVHLANQVLARAGGLARTARLELQAQRPAGAEPSFTSYADDVAEAAGVATAAAKLIANGTRASEIAVLYRTNAQSEPFEQALAEAGVPYLLRGGERFFARREVREAVVLLRGAARSADAAQSLGQVTRDALSSAGWSAEAPAGTGAVRERWESLQALAALADEIEQTRSEATLAELVTELDERAAAQHAPTVEGVTLASLHAAKGLEWDAVFLTGLTEGLLPISFAEGLTAVEEERRLLYVGVTRAREHLALSWARSRTPGGRASRKPSRFLDGLRPADQSDDENRSSAKEPGRKSRRGRPMPTTCRTCGKALMTGAERKVGRCTSCPPTYDEATFEALRAWRLETATEAKVPAYVVFTDATLTAIAETRPSSTQELAGIAGVGAAKLERYGPAVLALLDGKDPAEGAS
jgi:DNA helicase-2/ATP-dependent DNA helicase PcrA